MKIMYIDVVAQVVPEQKDLPKPLSRQSKADMQVSHLIFLLHK